MTTFWLLWEYCHVEVIMTTIHFSFNWRKLSEVLRSVINSPPWRAPSNLSIIQKVSEISDQLVHLFSLTRTFDKSLLSLQIPNCIHQARWACILAERFSLSMAYMQTTLTIPAFGKLYASCSAIKILSMALTGFVNGPNWYCQWP